MCQRAAFSVSLQNRQFFSTAPNPPPSRQIPHGPALSRFSNTKCQGTTLSPAPAGGVTVADGADGQSLTVTPKAKLAAGSYKVDWAVTAANGHQSTGSYQINVK
ncbi:hypothetical protein C0V82_14300 [Niveispirillum cyanobacteriorum]|uniref:CopC domain-containing protein n=1 Tax=Niveispirillum cyanobacteriorum TaxID=1612173 RepID=A0A2K9NDS8_9PROT|nr:hypothetical protein C0V82_14300 [Niveispirillum cyanobacteriorum]